MDLDFLDVLIFCRKEWQRIGCPLTFPMGVQHQLHSVFSSKFKSTSGLNPLLQVFGKKKFLHNIKNLFQIAKFDDECFGYVLKLCKGEYISRDSPNATADKMKIKSLKHPEKTPPFQRQSKLKPS